MSIIFFKQRRDYVLRQLDIFSQKEVAKSKISQPIHSAGFLASELDKHFIKERIDDHMRFIDLIYYSNPYNETKCYVHLGSHEGYFKEYENRTIKEILRGTKLPLCITKIFDGCFDTELKHIPMYSNLRESLKNIFRVCLNCLRTSNIQYHNTIEKIEYPESINDYLFCYDQHPRIDDSIKKLYFLIRSFTKGVLNQFKDLYAVSKANYNDFNFNNITNNFKIIAQDFVKNMNNYDEDKKILFKFICSLMQLKLRDFKDSVIFGVHYDICFNIIEAIHLYNNYKPINFEIHGRIWSSLYFNIENKNL